MYPGQYAGGADHAADRAGERPVRARDELRPGLDGLQGLENGKETIFAYQASANDGEPDGNNANYGERLNFPHSGSPFGCCGFHQPTFAL